MKEYWFSLATVRGPLGVVVVQAEHQKEAILALDKLLPERPDAVSVFATEVAPGALDDDFPRGVLVSPPELRQRGFFTRGELKEAAGKA